MTDVYRHESYDEIVALKGEVKTKVVKPEKKETPAAAKVKVETKEK